MSARKLDLWIGCDSSEFPAIEKQPISKNQLEVALGHNFLDLAVPNNRHMEIKELIDYIKQRLSDKMPDLNDKLRQFGLANLEGRLSLAN